MKTRFIPRIIIGVSASLLLSACGDSDLADIEDRELDTARRVQLAEQLEQASEPEQGAAQTGVELEDYDLVFSDEFNGDTINSTKWVTAQQWGPDLVINDEQQYYIDTQSNADFGYNPFSFDGESLIISAIETPENLSAVANAQPYLSGVLSTAGNFDLTYGYIEARMDLPEGTGLWPAFWMLSTEFEALKPQLFIVEGNGAKPESVFHNYNYHDEQGNLRSPGQWEVTQESFAEGFHTFGLSWSAEELLFYIDGIPRYRIIGENVSQQAMYLIVNLAVGGVWTGSPDASTEFPAELKIDYIRAYKRKAS